MTAVGTPIALTCDRCALEFVHVVSFGRRPRYCGDECRAAAARERGSGVPTWASGEIATRVCRRCDEPFTYTQTHGGVPWYCNECAGLAAAASRERCRDHTAQYLRDYRERNRESLKRQRADRYDPERQRQKNLEKRIRRYGLTVAEHAAMVSTQADRCACCRRPADPTRHFAIDHDHACCPDSQTSCGKCVRGLLCWHCNTNRITDEMVLHKAAYILYWRNVGLSSGDEHLEWLRQWINTQAALINIEPFEIRAGDHAHAR